MGMRELGVSVLLGRRCIIAVAVLPYVHVSSTDVEQQRSSLLMLQVAESRASGELEEERKKVTAKMEVGHCLGPVDC